MRGKVAELVDNVNLFLAIMNEQDSDWITPAEAARLRKVSREAIRKLMESKRIRSLRFGGRPFVSKSAVLSYQPAPSGRKKK
jgi:excisionase family DNA binding protein